MRASRVARTQCVRYRPSAAGRGQRRTYTPEPQRGRDAAAADRNEGRVWAAFSHESHFCLILLKALMTKRHLSCPQHPGVARAWKSPWQLRRLRGRQSPREAQGARTAQRTSRDRASATPSCAPARDPTQQPSALLTPRAPRSPAPAAGPSQPPSRCACAQAGPGHTPGTAVRSGAETSPYTPVRSQGNVGQPSHERD